MPTDDTRRSRFVHKLSISLAIVAGLVVLCVIATAVTALVATRKYENLRQAAKKGDLFAMHCFLWKGADVNAKKDDYYGRTPLHWAAIDGQVDVAELLIARGADVYAKSYAGSTPLHHAASSGDAEVAELLIEKGADVNAKNNRGHTPLHWAANEGYAEMAQLLIAEGADVNAKSNEGETPLQITVDEATRRLLIECGAVE